MGGGKVEERGVRGSGGWRVCLKRSGHSFIQKFNKVNKTQNQMNPIDIIDFLGSAGVEPFSSMSFFLVFQHK